MSKITKPTLEEAARRNPSMTPARVRQMQEIVKQLQDCGVLQPSKYGLQPGLTGPNQGVAATHAGKMMNRVGGDA